MFFVGSGAFGYEESAYEKLKIIENTYPQGYIDTGNIAERLKGGAGSPYGTPSISAEASLYGKAMAKTIRMTENLYKDYDTELKIINETIARLKSSPKNIKYEMEARNLKLNILKSKLDVIKTIVDSLRYLYTDSANINLDIETIFQHLDNIETELDTK